MRRLTDFAQAWFTSICRTAAGPLPECSMGRDAVMIGIGKKRESDGLGWRKDDPARTEKPARSWPQRISDNLAYGLLVYTALQIFVTMKQLKEVSNSMLPYIALVVLVAAIIPAARTLESHWIKLEDGSAFDPVHARRFQRDRAIIWLVSIGLPFALAALARFVAAI